MRDWLGIGNIPDYSVEFERVNDRITEVSNCVDAFAEAAFDTIPVDVDVYLYPATEGSNDVEPQNVGAIEVNYAHLTRGGVFEMVATVVGWTKVNDPGTVILFVPSIQPNPYEAAGCSGQMTLEINNKNGIFTGKAEWWRFPDGSGVWGVRGKLMNDVGQTKFFGKRIPKTLGNGDKFSLSISLP